MVYEVDEHKIGGENVKMKVMLINGSPRKNGATGTVLRKMGEMLLSYKNVEIDLVHLADLKMEYCKGCEVCYKKGGCIIKDDAEALASRLQNVDAVIVGSPTYASNVSGLMKTFIDRGHFVIEQALVRKYVVIVATGENYGKQDVVKILRKLVVYSGGRICGSLALNVEFEKGIKIDDKLKRKIKENSEKLYQSVRRKKRYFIQELVHKVVFEVGIKPFVLRKGEDYRGVRKMWEEMGIGG